MLNAAVLDLTALVDDTTVGRDALLALAEAQALLALLFGPSAPEPALAHRAAAIAALQRAQAWHPPGRLGQDHLSLLARLEDAVITGEADQG
jgi:hypothetical protein